MDNIKSIFLIVKNTNGPCGHGGGGEEYVSLLHDGRYCRGNPYPAFKKQEEAEKFRKTKDEYDFYHVIEVPLFDSINHITEGFIDPRGVYLL